MYWFYYQQAEGKVTGLPHESTEHGELLGTIVKEGYLEVPRNFFVASLLGRKGLKVQGITIDTTAIDSP